MTAQVFFLFERVVSLTKNDRDFLCDLLTNISGYLSLNGDFEMKTKDECVVVVLFTSTLS